MAGYRFGAKPTYYEHDGFLLEDYMKSAEPKTDSVDDYEDAWLDWMPYKISAIAGCAYMSLSVFSIVFGALMMTFTGTWSEGAGWFAPAFVLGILFTIAGIIGWVFLLPVVFDEYKKWRKARRRFARAKD